tara:strand:- start:1524 stop:1694 length:171 start_codon:yes stop_codon:yes gene_type:complete
MKDLIITWCELMEEPEFDLSAAEADEVAWFHKLEWVVNGVPTAEGRAIFREYGIHE